MSDTQRTSNQSDIEPLVTALIHAVKMERDEFHERCNNSYSTDALMLCKERVALCKAAVLAAMRPAHAAEPSAARRAEYWKAEHLAGNAEIERLQQRVHELERELTAVRSSHDSLVAQRAAEPPNERLAALELELATIKKYARQCDLDAAAYELIEIEDRASATKDASHE